MDINDTPTNYALNGKIMLCSVIILFTVVCVIVCFHSYNRLCSNRHQRRRRIRRSSSQGLIVSHHPISPTTNDVVSPPQGLDVSLLKNLPIFVYSSAAAAYDGPVLECAVCLSEFEDHDRGRVLPKCSHSFHLECIDAWFRSHSSCPLCRAPVRPDISLPNGSPPEAASAAEVFITVNELVPRVMPEFSQNRSDDRNGRAEVGLSESSPVAGFRPEWCGRKPEDLVSLAVEVASIRGSEKIMDPESNRSS